MNRIAHFGAPDPHWVKGPIAVGTQDWQKMRLVSQTGVRGLLALVATSMAALAIGCGRSDRTATVPVEGTVTLEGKPVEGAVVNFIPLKDRPATGITDAQGRFHLSTHGDKDGAITGTHRVTITKSVKKNPKDNSPYAQTVSVIPDRYRHPEKSGFSVEVTSGGPNDFPLPLKKQ